MVSDRAYLDAYLRNQVVLDRDLRRVMRATIKSLQKEITRLAAVHGRGAALRLTQLTLTRDIMQSWVAMGDVIETHIAASSDDIAKVQAAFDKVLLDQAGVGITQDFARSLQQTARAGLDSYISRAHHGMTLSDRVYRNGRASVRTVNNLIDQGILAGRSAREIALSVRRYISPTTPGGMSYAAMRLGRTELNNAFHETSKRMAVEDPFVNGIEWHLSGSHPKQDVCNSLVKKYDPERVPAKPHPQCLCYTTPVTISEAQFLRNLKRGQYDDMALLVA